MTTTPTIPNRAILSAEERAMLALQAKNLPQQPFDQVASATGIHPDILRMLVRDNILKGVMPSWKNPVGACDLEQAKSIADQLNADRNPVKGQGITASDAAEKYGFDRTSIHSWHKNGWVAVVATGARHTRFFDEGDIAFARALADLRGQVAGKSVFPAKLRSGRPRKS